MRNATARSLLAYLHEETPRPLLCEALPRAAEVEVVPLPRAPGRLRRRQDPVEERLQHRPQLPVQQLSPERIVVGGGPAGAARRAEREQAGGLKVRSHFDLQLWGQAQEHRDVMMRDVPPCRRRHRRGGNSGRHTTYDTRVESKRLGATQRNVNHVVINL